MGNMLPCCFTGRHSNRILPTNSTVLALGIGNKDLALYRRHRKRCDTERGFPVAPGALGKTDTKEVCKGQSSKKEYLENSEDFINSQDDKKDKEMMDWVDSILMQNHLLPRAMTFDNKRHLSMRSRYANIIQVINLRNIIHETKDEVEEQASSLAPSVKIYGLKKDKMKKIKKHLSHETFNLGISPTPKVSTRISKDAVKRNKQKDSQLKFQGGKSPPPPKFWLSGSSASNKGLITSSELKGESKSGSENTKKQFHVSSSWLDEDFEESILSYPSEVPNTKAIPQCSRLSSKPHLENHGKKNKSVQFKIEPQLSEPAVHNLGLFLSASEEEQSERKARSRIFNAFKKRNRTSASYATTDSFLCDEESPDS